MNATRCQSKEQKQELIYTTWNAYKLGIFYIELAVYLHSERNK